MEVGSKCVAHGKLVKYESDMSGVPISSLCPCCGLLLVMRKTKLGVGYAYCRSCEEKWGGHPIMFACRPRSK